MNIEEKTKEKTCAFYASDYHFEMLSLPYINKKLEENNEIIIMTENDLNETINTFMSKINLEKTTKEKILNIDCEDNNLKKIKIIKQNSEKGKKTIIFIKGKEYYIKNVNENIGKWVEKSENLETIDCYDINEIGNNLSTITDKYGKILMTSGEKNIK